MTCEEIREKLNEYIDGELSKDEEIDFEMHLYECEECKKRYMALKELSEAVRETQCTDLPEDFEISIPKENKIRYLWRKYEKTAAVMVAAVALLIFAQGIKTKPFITPNSTAPAPSAEQTDIISAPVDMENSDKAENPALPSDKTEDREKAKTGKEKGENKAETQAGSSAQSPFKEQKEEPPAAEEYTIADEKTDAALEVQSEKEFVNIPKEEVTAAESAVNGSEDAAAADGAPQAAPSSASGGSVVKNENASNSAAKSAAGGAKKAADLSPVLSYSMPSRDSFLNPDVYDNLNSRLSSLKTRASSASDGEKQSILNEFYSLKQEISYNLK